MSRRDASAAARDIILVPINFKLLQIWRFVRSKIALDILWCLLIYFQIRWSSFGCLKLIKCLRMLVHLELLFLYDWLVSCCLTTLCHNKDDLHRPLLTPAFGLALPQVHCGTGGLYDWIQSMVLWFRFFSYERSFFYWRNLLVVIQQLSNKLTSISYIEHFITPQRQNNN